MGLVVEGNSVWYLVIVVIFMGLGQAGAKRCRGCLKFINWGGNVSHKKESDSFYKEGEVLTM